MPAPVLKLQPNPLFWATVHITVPGETDKAAIELQFRHKGKRAMAAWLASGRGEVVAQNTTAAASVEPAPKPDEEFLGEVINDWRGPLNEAGQPEPYSQNGLAKLLDQYPAAATEIYAAYRNALVESRAKN